MSEFFNDSNSLSASDKFRQERKAKAEAAKHLVTEQAVNLIEPLAELRKELQRRGVAPTVSVVKVDKTPAGVLDKNRSHLFLKWRQQLAKPTEHNPLIARSLGTPRHGWLLSQADHYAGNRTITLLEDGQLVMAGPLNAQTHRVEIDPADGESRIDLTQFPFNPAFTQNRGYAETHGMRPRLADHEENPVTMHTPEAHVAINLEHLERDIRTNGRRLLGMAP